MAHYHSKTPKRHIGWSNSQAVGLLDLGKLTKFNYHSKEYKQNKTAKVTISKSSGRKQFTGQRKQLKQSQYLDLLSHCWFQRMVDSGQVGPIGIGAIDASYLYRHAYIYYKYICMHAYIYREIYIYICLCIYIPVYAWEINYVKFKVISPSMIFTSAPKVKSWKPTFFLIGSLCIYTKWDLVPLKKYPYEGYFLVL